MLEYKANNLLEKAGWYEGRKIDITKQVEFLEQEGYEVFDAAKKFMEKYGELNIKATYIDFQGEEDYDEHSTEYEELKFYYGHHSNYDEKVGEKTIPVCELFNGEFIVCISESGKFFIDQGLYALDSDGFWNGQLGEFKGGFLSWVNYRAGKEFKLSGYKNKNYIVD